MKPQNSSQKFRILGPENPKGIFLVFKFLENWEKI